MAGKIPQHFIDEILARVDIVDVINPRVTLKKSGSNYSACCPFHNEKTPSFTVSQTKQFYHCFGCGENGSAISFLMNYDNMHFVDAIETLAEQLGMEVPRDEAAAQNRSNNKPLYALLEKVATHYEQALKKSPSAVEYLKNRGLSGEIAKQFAIGYAEDGWDSLQKDFAGEEAALIKTGMLIKNDAGRVYPRFRDRVMFPIRDRRGRVIAFGGRVLVNEEPKYLNSPETPLFHKGSELYGLFEARKAAQDAGTALVVEGYMDVVALAQHGVNNAVATLGTAANQQHSELLFRAVPNIVFCFDGDKAGRSAAWRALVATLPCLEDGRDTFFLFLPDGEDPDSIVQTHGKEGFDELLAARTPIIDFLYNYLSADIDTSSIGGKAQLAEKAKPLVHTMPAGVYKKLALQRLENLLGIEMGSKRVSRPQAKTSLGAALGKGNMTVMSRAVLLTLQHPSLVGEIDPDQFEISDALPGADVLLKLVGYADADPTITTARLLERFRDADNYNYLQSLATRSLFPDGREFNLDEARADYSACIEALKSRSLKTHSDQLQPSRRTGLLSIRKPQ
ncbi:MAG: DNA primase [Granulosicoccaceae bacterium]